MARVTVEDCVDKIPNRFDLVLLAAQRAREISGGAELTVARDRDKNPVVALREIAAREIDTTYIDAVEKSERQRKEREALEWATINGARAFRLDRKIGTLSPGKKADIVMLRADDVNMAPVHDPVYSIVEIAGAGGARLAWRSLYQVDDREIAEIEPVAGGRERRPVAAAEAEDAEVEIPRPFHIHRSGVDVLKCVHRHDDHPLGSAPSRQQR